VFFTSPRPLPRGILSSVPQSAPSVSPSLCLCSVLCAFPRRTVTPSPHHPIPRCGTTSPPYGGSLSPHRIVVPSHRLSVPKSPPHPFSSSHLHTVTPSLLYALLSLCLSAFLLSLCGFLYGFQHNNYLIQWGKGFLNIRVSIYRR
jgi:hypothetical protein